MGIYVVIGASLLGALSCMLIAWSLWTRSQARKRARQRQLATGQHAAIPPLSGPYPVVQAAGHTVVAAAPGHDEEPRTEFMSSADLFGQDGAPEEPTQFLSEADLYPGQEPEDEHEATTAFMTDEELFAEQQLEQDEHEASTAFMTDEELFGEADDEHEVATAFMTTDELYGRARAPVDATVVLAEGAVIPEPEPQPPRPPDRPPVHRMPVRPAAPSPAVAKPEQGLKPTLPGPKPAAPASRYTGFVGDRARDDDDDDDFDENDPETELVHQAELLRLISLSKRSD